MSARITCPACRGSRKVMKLGAMTGNCNTCNGEGTIESSIQAPKGLGVLGNPDLLSQQAQKDSSKLKAVTLKEFLDMDPEEVKKRSSPAKYPHHETDHHKKFTEEDAKYEAEYLTPLPQTDFVPPSRNMDVSNGKHKRNKKTHR